MAYAEEDAQELALTEALAVAAGDVAREWWRDQYMEWLRHNGRSSSSTSSSPSTSTSNDDEMSCGVESSASRFSPWAHFEATAELVALMQAGGQPDTRVFLKPIYKACKHLANDRPTVAKTSACWTPNQRPLRLFDSDGRGGPEAIVGEAAERLASWHRRVVDAEVTQATARWRAQPGRHFAVAVAIGEWLLALANHGDEALGIYQPQPQLQPSFVFNTIITSKKEELPHELAPSVRARTQPVDRSPCAPICLFLSRYPSILSPILLDVRVH